MYTLLAQQDASPMGAMVMLFVYVAIIMLFVVSMWKIFEKAGQPGWAAIVPIYNVVVMLQIAGKPVWWLVLLFVPLVNVVISILLYIGFAEKFGKGAGFAIGLAFLPIIFLPMLAFGDAQYQAAAAPPGASPAAAAAAAAAQSNPDA